MTDYGSMKILQSDNGTEFVNSLVKQLTSTYGIDHRLITPYHPAANGLVERRNKEVGRMLKKHLKGASAQWEAWLPTAQLALNLRQSERTKTSPFTLMFGRSFNDFCDYSLVKPTLDISTTLEKWLGQQSQNLKVLPEIASLSRVTKSQQRAQLDSQRKQQQPLAIGTKVMAQDHTRTSKWDPLYEGPFEVAHVGANGAYTLRDLTGNIIEPKRTIDMLKLIPATDDTTHTPPTSMPKASEGGKTSKTGSKGGKRKQTKPIEGQEPSSWDVDSKDNMEHFEVERIENHKGTDRYSYFVKWKNWPPTHNSWVEESDFDDLAIVRKYWKDKEGPGAKKKNTAKQAKH